MALQRLSMVYAADAGVRGEIAYVFNKLRGAHCALCDITHSAVRRKSAFDDLTCSLGIPTDVLHRNEQDADLAAFTSGLEPLVVAHTEHGPEVLMDSDALEELGGDLDRFGEELRSRMEALSHNSD